MSLIEQQRDWYLSSFQDFEKSLNGEASHPFHARRKAALTRFLEKGFPTTRDEEWKYTDLTRISANRFDPVFSYSSGGITAATLEPSFLGTPNSIVFVDGLYAAEFSRVDFLPAGVRLESLAYALRHTPADLEPHLAHYASLEESPFIALGTAFLRDGVVIVVPDATIVTQPIHLIFVSSNRLEPFLVHPRVLVTTGKNCQLSILESHIGMGTNVYWSNAISEIVIGENSIVEHQKYQNESENAYHISWTHVHQARNSSYVSNSFALGGSITRNDITAVLDGEGAETTLNGLYLGTETRHIDNHTTIVHARPHCQSHELYKGILSGRSRGVFNGKIFVRKDAQKTDAKQTNKNLILSDEASVDTKPQLEIFANDVKCTHGATIGQLEEDAIFYLRSRGLSTGQARDLLIYAFTADVVERVSHAVLCERLKEVIHQRLEHERVVLPS